MTTATAAAPHYVSTKSTATAPVPTTPSPTEHRRRYIVEVSDPGLDLQGDRVLRGALDCATAPPVPLLIGHDHSGLPIGMVGDFSYGPSGKLRGTASLPPPGVSAKADELAGLIAAGIGIQFSIGFDAQEHTRNPEGGYNFSKISLREISAVPIGAAHGTGVLAQVKHALGAKGVLDNDGRDPSRDPRAATCTYGGRGCPKLSGQPCPAAEACPLHLGGSGAGRTIGGPMKNASVFDKRRIDATEHLGHADGTERTRNQWAMAHGKAAIAARRRDAEVRRGWMKIRDELLSVDPRERPRLKLGVDVSRAVWDSMPVDVRSVLAGHDVPDARMEGLG